MNPLCYTDFYKTGHIDQYPKGTQYVYSNFTPRQSIIPYINHVVVFGVQYFVKEYLIKRFNEDFFNKPKHEVVTQYKDRLETSLAKQCDVTHIEKLHDLGYLPIKLKALPEGSISPIGVPVLTIRNTKPEFFWLTNYLETLLSNTLWQAITSATIAYEYRKLFNHAAKLTSTFPEFVPYQGHDFSMRGLSSLESACISGAAHLLSFVGTDTVAAIDFLEKYYNALPEEELIGGSIPATEHSVMSIGGADEKEIETFKRLITEVYPSGFISIVSDTWDYWKVIDEYLPQLKDIIIERSKNPSVISKVVIRPDSGDPEKIICGDPNSSNETVRKGSITRLWEIFGGTTNWKGYKELNPCIGLIYGDSITLERASSICHNLESQGFASTNVVYGIGSFTYQYNTRDTFGFAMKATHAIVNGESFNIFKDPKTSTNVKRSAKGLLKVDNKYILHEEVTEKEEDEGLLQVVFCDGLPFVDDTLAKIRYRLLQT